MEVGDAVAVGGEAAGCEGGERIVHGIEETHPAEIVSQGTSHGDQQVGAPQPVGGGGDTRVEFAQFQPGGFGRKELLLAYAEGGKQRQGEKDDAHAAYPVHQAAPEENGVGEAVDVVEGAGAGGGETGHGLEEGHGHAVGHATGEEGEHAE